jgi:hypothetical protein
MVVVGMGIGSGLVLSEKEERGRGGWVLSGAGLMVSGGVPT